MAQKRMFSLNVVDTDKFLEMPISSRLLYYELGMRADDDGFVSNWKKILLFTGLKEDDMKVLIAKQFIIPFESGVIVIRHWRLNNYLQNDRTKPTIYQKEFKSLGIDNNNVYIMDTTCIHSIDKNSIDKNSIDINNKTITNNWNDYEKCECETKTGEKCLRRSTYKIDGKNYCNQHSKQILGDYYKTKKETYGEFNNVFLTGEEYYKLEQANLLPYIEKLSSYIASKGKKYKSHYATILTWSRGDKQTKTSIEPEWLDKEIKPKVNKEAEEFERRFFEELEKEQNN